MRADQDLSTRPDAGARAAHAAASRRLLIAAEDLAQRLPALLVAAERVAATVFQGVHGRRQVGQGESFWQFRRYEPGDATARIDWRRSARSDRLYLRQTEWEAAQTVWLWRDATASMSYRSSSNWRSKRETAEVLLLALATLLQRTGERASLVGRPDVRVAARGGCERLAEALLLEEDAAAAAALPKTAPPARNARLVVFSDFLVPLPAIRAAIEAFAAAGIHGHLVQIIDPAEATLPFAGRVLLEGGEGEGEILFGRIEALRPAYQQRLLAHHDAILALVRAAGCTLMVHHCDRPAQAALLALYTALGATPPRWGRDRC